MLQGLTWHPRWSDIDAELTRFSQDFPWCNAIRFDLPTLNPPPLESLLAWSRRNSITLLPILKPHTGRFHYPAPSNFYAKTIDLLSSYCFPLVQVGNEFNHPYHSPGWSTSKVRLFLTKYLPKISPPTVLNFSMDWAFWTRPRPTAALIRWVSKMPEVDYIGIDYYPGSWCPSRDPIAAISKLQDLPFPTIITETGWSTKPRLYRPGANETTRQTQYIQDVLDLGLDTFIYTAYSSRSSRSHETWFGIR